MKSIFNFQRPNARADFERMRSAVRSMLNNSPSGEIVRVFEQLAAELDAGVRKVKPELLGSPLSWNPEDRELSEWIHTQHCELADLARRAADLFERREGFDSANTLRMTALAFFHWGEAAKWIVGRRERPAYGWMHWLMSMASQAGCNYHPCEVRLDGRPRSATLESLFLRTLILDRFAGGNLSRPQSEVLDAWLWEWMPDIKATSAWPGEAAFRADLDGKGGLRRGRRMDDGPALYLATAPLEAKRRSVVKEFHSGRIVPSLGVAADFRVEEHVAVLERLRVAFEPGDDQDPVRQVRRSVAGNVVEVRVGLAEILQKGHGPRRLLRLVDVSDAGYGFEATEAEAAHIAVDDVVSLRASSHEGSVLGRVTRRVPGSIHGHVTIGVQAMSDHPKVIVLSRTNPQGRSGDDETVIYVAGPDACGSQDSFLVPEKMLQQDGTHDAWVNTNQFTIQLNRVRRKGRGWALMGFEIVAAGPVAAAPDTADVP
jgi:hypothetical protein